VAPDGHWQPIADNLANTGRYDWVIPEGLSGRVVLRITVVDQGRSRVEAAAKFDLAPPTPDPAAGGQATPDAEPGEAALVAHTETIDDEARDRSRRLYQAALWHRSRGETRLAMARLRDALRLDPTQSLALVDLASILYGEGDHEASMQAYKLALQQNPDLRSGLEGAARTAIALRDYPKAADYLRRITSNDPNDVSAWLNLGDVAIYQGDELTAREHYERAATRDPNATEVITQARMRLADLSWLRERYQQTSSEP
jgi:tetratricopeptide (TPR) repeat protein